MRQKPHLEVIFTRNKDCTVYFVPHQSHWNRIRKGSLQGQYGQEEHTQRLKILSICILYGHVSEEM